MAKKLKIAVLGNQVRWSISVMNAFLRSGHEIVRIPFSGKTMKEVFAEIEASRPDFCFTQNFHLCEESNPGLQEELDYFFSENKFPFAIWYLDNPEFQGNLNLQERWRREPFPKNCLFFINDSSFASFFKKRKLPYYHLPIGVDKDIEALRYPHLVDLFRADLRFTGQPIVQFSPEPPCVEVFREGYKIVYTEEVFKLIEMHTKNITAEQKEKLSGLFTESLDQLFDRYYTTKEDFFSAEEKYLKSVKNLPPYFYEISEILSSRRQEFYSWCQMTCYLYELKSKGLEIHGSPTWNSFFPDQKVPARQLGWEELFSSYQATKINFCFTKWSLPTTVHDRVFEILVAGGFPLTDYREYLTAAFKKDEIVFYRSIEEAKDLIDYYLKADSERQKLISKGRARVLASHTYDLRIQELIRESALHWNL
ncbi:MAG: CgeB family protein [Bacteriovoracaceae bacterium]|nr:CgeB family protein [Bacteriovoracaceae bacterium]